MAERTGFHSEHATRALLGTAAIVALVGTVALVVQRPLLFPGLGPTALLFAERPLQPAASPRNAVVGHLIAALSGYGCVLAFQLSAQADYTPDLQRVAASALAVALTGAALIAARAPHPPAGATALSVSLGLLPDLPAIGALLTGVVLATVAGFCLNRLLHVDMPVWSPLPGAHGTALRPPEHRR